MRIQPPVVDYRDFRFSKLGTETYRHLKLLLFWPLFGILFLFVERLNPVQSYHVVHCALDDRIPFNEWFLFPYLFWFVFVAGMHIYTLLYDVRSFRKFMVYIILTYSLTSVIYLLYPTCQDLRPIAFERDNALTRFMTGFYRFDTNTNVCPSLHVVGSLAVMFAAWDTERFRSPGWKAAFCIAAVLICASTVFLKQHSVVDVGTALVLSLAAYFAVYRERRPAKHHYERKLFT